MIAVRVEEVRDAGDDVAVTQRPKLSDTAPVAVHPPGPSMSVSALAKRLGVAPSTLRTWDRRYGIGPSGHARGSHRRYTPTDVARLECMQRALASGSSPAEAAQHAINAESTGTSIGGHQIGECTFADIWVNSGRIGQIDHDQIDHDIATATAALDEWAIRRIITEAIAEHGVVGMWTDVAVPVLAGGHGAAGARMFVECATGVLSAYLLDAPVGRGGRTLVVAVPDGHGIGLRRSSRLECRALSAALAVSGVNTRMVTPPDRRALLAVVGVEQPDVVVLWGDWALPPSGTEVDDPSAVLGALVRALRRRCRGLTIVAAGPAVGSLDHLPRSVRAYTSLGEAVEAVGTAAHG